MNKEQIEKIFRTSNSHEELFDTFILAVSDNCNDIELYKILLANPALNINEVTMFTEKIAKECPSECYDLYFWVAELFSGVPFSLDYYEKALEYYTKVFEMDTGNHEPLISALNLFNYDLDLSLNQEIMGIIERNADLVKQRSNVYYALADHYNKIGDDINFERYSSLANRAAKNEE